MSVFSEKRFGYMLHFLRGNPRLVIIPKRVFIYSLWNPYSSGSYGTKMATIQSRTGEKIEDFEEAFRVIKVDENTYVGAHPLRLPATVARGVYGGHTIAQTLLVAIESTRGADGNTFIPHSYHNYFIAAGDARVPMTYKVENTFDNDEVAKRSIIVIQEGRIRSTAICSLVKRGTKVSGSTLDFQPPVPALQERYPDVNSLHQVHHTDYIRNAYSDEFVDYEKAPEEQLLKPAERWITVWSGIINEVSPQYIDHPDVQELESEKVARMKAGSIFPKSKRIPSELQKSFKDPIFNLVGLADLSDSALLTTLARVLHLPWNPTEDHPFQEFDRDKNALLLLKDSFNVLHLFHYNAMSLDHHIYFHLDEEYDTEFDIVKDWLCFSYQVKRLANNRTLVRGHMFNKDRKCVATVIQEGLTYMFSGVPDKAKL